jgi:hypothetical protein
LKFLNEFRRTWLQELQIGGTSNAGDGIRAGLTNRAIGETLAMFGEMPKSQRSIAVRGGHDTTDASCRSDRRG